MNLNGSADVSSAIRKQRCLDVVDELPQNGIFCNFIRPGWQAGYDYPQRGTSKNCRIGDRNYRFLLVAFGESRRKNYLDLI